MIMAVFHPPYEAPIITAPFATTQVVAPIRVGFTKLDPMFALTAPHENHQKHKNLLLSNLV